MRVSRLHLPTVALALASLILAAEPLRWLWQSWQSPAYQSHGALYVLLLGAACAASVLSGPARGPAQGARPGQGLVLLFLAAALVRLAGQVLAVNTLSALALAVDVYALARLMRVQARPFALSPLWLALFFLFALPLAPILERVLGFPLQVLSAKISCGLLSVVFADLHCAGVRLRVGAVDVLVDLPCAGASGLLLMLALWTALNALFRPRLSAAALGLVAVLVAALLGNGLRISLLAAGLAQGWDMMAPLPHSAVGLVSLGLSALPIVLWYRPKPARSAQPWALTLPPVWATPVSLGAVALALAAVFAPQEPLDRSTGVVQRALPAQLLGHPREAQPLSAFEQRFFATYGGQAQKASYGPLGLNLTQTSAPLRHLHAPATCLLGMGFDVDFLGTQHSPLPSAVYRATGPEGQAWLVSVSYVSDQGHRTASVGEAVWTWLQGGAARWTSVQRITPISLPPEARAAFEQAALASLDL